MFLILIEMGLIHMTINCEQRSLLIAFCWLQAEAYKVVWGMDGALENLKILACIFGMFRHEAIMVQKCF